MRVLNELNEFHKKTFKQIVERKFDSRKFDPKKSIRCFWESLGDLQKILRNLNCTYRLEDVKESLAEVYIREARKRGITPNILSLEKRKKERLKNLRKSKKPLFSVFVTPAMEKGAKKAGFRDRMKLGDDY